MVNSAASAAIAARAAQMDDHDLSLARGAAIPLLVPLAVVVLVIAWPLRRAVRR